MELKTTEGGDAPRSTERLMIIMETLSRASAHGLRLTDIVEATELGKTTAHRLLNGLADQGLVDFDEETGRYFIGIRLLSWASAARNRFGIAKLAEPALTRLARKTQDTVYLVGKIGDHAVCLDSREGTFPIKVLTLNVGDQRPLGVGAGSMAIMAAMSDPEIERVMAQQQAERLRYAFSDDRLRDMVAFTRQHGYAFSDTHIYKDMAEMTGMAAVAVALRRSDGQPAGAIHVTAVTPRLTGTRRENVVSMVVEERQRLEDEIRPMLDAGIGTTRVHLA
ncbi:IclR family transcriptional regulator [Mesorhizobium sp. J428]|uniref:IclR family transcriptional regulator n=1 Tax=Mesorhizobium sp. J428 TaxID=2898440 RepID=UPI0021512F6F|nr:IclR family transcriptional regulator [Mesorhizobium sp. J428]MCR5857195.1 IclR family transcriptional regulator [Mesorhizobium sp. J428]